MTFNLRDFYHRQLSLLGADSLKSTAAASAPIYEELRGLFEAGKLKAIEPEPVRLEDAVQAYSRLEEGAARKMAIVMEQN